MTFLYKGMVKRKKYLRLSVEHRKCRDVSNEKLRTGILILSTDTYK